MQTMIFLVHSCRLQELVEVVGSRKVLTFGGPALEMEVRDGKNIIIITLLSPNLHCFGAVVGINGRDPF